MGTPYPTPITQTSTKIGFIGLGVMGSAMATRLLSSSYSVTLFARSPHKTIHLQSLGAQLSDSPTRLAQNSDIVFTMLSHPNDVKEVVLGQVVEGLRSGGVVVDCTSSSPELAVEVFRRGRERGCWSVDAPVSGGDIGARDGKLSILAGGEADVVKWLSPLFEILGRVTYLGGPGSGQSCKIANQITVCANLVGLSEGLVFAEKAGLDTKRWLEAVRGGAAGSMVMELFGDRIVGRDFKAGGFAEYMVKDLGMGLDVVEEGDGNSVVVLPGAALAKQLFAGMVASGDGKLGAQGLITVIERINGK